MAVERFLEKPVDDELMIAVEVIQLFIDNGADPRIIDCDGKTPLHLLAERCSPDCKEPYYCVFEAVLEGGGHLDQVTADGVTVLKILLDFLVAIGLWVFPDEGSVLLEVWVCCISSAVEHCSLRFG